MRMVAVVLGGGVGQRLGAGMPKQLLTLGGKTLLEHCVAAFEQAPGVDEILVVMARGYTGQVKAMLADAGYRKVTAVIEGGVTRPDSTRAALAAIAARAIRAAPARHRAGGRCRARRLRRAAARRRPPAGGPADHRGLRRRAAGP